MVSSPSFLHHHDIYFSAFLATPFAASPLVRPLMCLSVGGKINKLFTGLWSVRIGKNCDQNHGNTLFLC